MFLCLLALQVLSSKTLQVTAMSLQEKRLHVCSCIDASQVKSLRFRHGWDPGGDWRPLLLPPNCFSTWKVQTDSDLSTFLKFLIKLLLATLSVVLRSKSFATTARRWISQAWEEFQAESLESLPLVQKKLAVEYRFLLNHTCRLSTI